VREDESLFLQLGGVPGDPVFLLIGAAGQPLFGAAWVGPLHVAPGAAVVALGVLPANGQLELGLAVPELGVGIEAVGLELQAAFIDGALLHLALSEPSAVLLLDRSL
jgi:hypothetical protein